MTLRTSTHGGAGRLTGPLISTTSAPWAAAARAIALQVTRELSARIIVQYNGFYDTWEGDPLLQYQINPFSIFYVGSTRDYAKLAVDPASQQDWRLTHRQYFLKLQYLFRI